MNYRKLAYPLLALVFSAITNYIIFDSLFRANSKQRILAWQQSEAVELQQGNLLTSFSKFDRVLAYGSDIRSVALVRWEIGQQPRVLISLGDQNSLGLLDQESPPRFETKSRQLGIFDYVFTATIDAEKNIVLVGRFNSTEYLTLLSLNLILISTIVGVFFFWFFRFNERQEQDRQKFLLDTIDSVLDAPHATFGESDIRTKSLSSEAAKDVLLKLHRAMIERDKVLAKTSLAKQVAHDIRSPLSALNAFSYKILDDSENSNSIRRAIKRISDIADDLLSQSQTQNQGSEPSLLRSKNLIALSSIIEDLVIEKNAVIANRSIELFKDFNPNETYIVEGNRAQLSRVISNLVDNAIESIDSSGKVTISLRNYRDSTQIAIADSGAGMSKETLNQIGRKNFSYGKSTHSKERGLGVYHANETIRNLGGRIDFQSVEGKGSLVSIVLPRPNYQSDFAT